MKQRKHRKLRSYRAYYGMYATQTRYMNALQSINEWFKEYCDSITASLDK